MSPIQPGWAATTLTAIEAADVGRIHSWQNDPGLRDLTMGFRGPLSTETTSDWVRSLREQTLRTRVAFAIRYENVLKGIVQLHTIDWVQRTAMLGLCIGDQADRGAGLGFIAASLILDYGFAGLDLHRIALTVRTSNQAADRLYQSLGFVREGTLRAAYFAAGRRDDVALYAMLRDEWHGVLPSTARRQVSRPESPEF